MQHAETFKKVIFALSDIVNNANLECGSEGIRLQVFRIRLFCFVLLLPSQAMGESNIALVSLFLPSSIFAQYECERSCVFGINFKSMMTVCTVKPVAQTTRTISAGFQVFATTRLAHHPCGEVGLSYDCADTQRRKPCFGIRVEIDGCEYGEVGNTRH